MLIIHPFVILNGEQKQPLATFILRMDQTVGGQKDPLPYALKSFSFDLSTSKTKLSEEYKAKKKRSLQEGHTKFVTDPSLKSLVQWEFRERALRPTLELFFVTYFCVVCQPIMVARTPPKQRKMVVPLDPVLIRETLKKVHISQSKYRTNPPNSLPFVFACLIPQKTGEEERKSSNSGL